MHRSASGGQARPSGRTPATKELAVPALIRHLLSGVTPRGHPVRCGPIFSGRGSPRKSRNTSSADAADRGVPNRTRTPASLQSFAKGDEAAGERDAADEVAENGGAQVHAAWGLSAGANLRIATEGQGPIGGGQLRRSWSLPNSACGAAELGPIRHCPGLGRSWTNFARVLPELSQVYNFRKEATSRTPGTSEQVWP